MIEIYLKIKMFFEFMFRIKINRCIIPALLMAASITSCSPEQRVSRIVNRYNLNILDTTIIKADTIHTVISKEVIKKDTTFYVFNDTIRTKIQVIKDSVFISSYIPQKTIVTKKILLQDKKKNWGLIFFILFLLLSETALIIYDYTNYEHKQKQK